MLRDLLLRIAVEGIVRARWSDEILDECFKAVARERPDLDLAALARTRRLMNEAIPDCLVAAAWPYPIHLLRNREFTH